MKKPTRNTSDLGFTLIEVTLAILIFGILSSAVLTAFNALFLSSQVLDRNITLTDMGHRCLNRMISDIASARISLPPAYAIPQTSSIDFEKNADPFRIVGDDGASRFPRLKFASLAHLPIDGNTRKGIARIVYYVEENEDQSFSIKRADDLEPWPPFEANRNDPVLCENVISLEFGYHGQTDEIQMAWDSESGEYGYATPQAISIKIEIGDAQKKQTLKTTAILPSYRGKK
jgi:general secretion pathway protein J